MLYGTIKENGLIKTDRIAHLTQEGYKNGFPTHEFDGIQIERRIYTDGDDEFIRINGFIFNLWTIENGGHWHIDYISRS